MKFKRWCLIDGDALATLAKLENESVDALITDPPYSSGGLHFGERRALPENKYRSSDAMRVDPTFTGDNMDQRAWSHWCRDWMGECLRTLKLGAYAMVFTDWRQLPSTTDAMQQAGFTWRGVIAWDKGRGSRSPHKGYIRHQCEYIVWGTKGACLKRDDAGPFDGCLSHRVKQSDKHHLTGKPTALMADLAKICRPDGLILDPFAGSGSTGVGALLQGRRFLGVERSAAYAEIARKRLKAAALGEVLKRETARPTR